MVFLCLLGLHVRLCLSLYVCPVLLVLLSVLYLLWLRFLGGRPLRVGGLVSCVSMVACMVRPVPTMAGVEDVGDDGVVLDGHRQEGIWNVVLETNVTWGREGIS